MVPSTLAGRGKGSGTDEQPYDPSRDAVPVGNVFISTSDCACMKVSIINNSAGFCTILHSTTGSEGFCKEWMTEYSNLYICFKTSNIVFVFKDYSFITSVFTCKKHHEG